MSLLEAAVSARLKTAKFSGLLFKATEFWVEDEPSLSSDRVVCSARTTPGWRRWQAIFLSHQAV